MHGDRTRFWRISGSVVPLPGWALPNPIELGELDVLPIFVLETGQRGLDAQEGTAHLQHYGFCEKVSPITRATSPAELELAVKIQDGVPFLRYSRTELQTLEVAHKPFASVVHLPTRKVALLKSRDEVLSAG